MITWGLPIWLYLWLAGIATGAYFAAFLAEHFGKYTNHRLLNTALYLGIPAAIAGVIFLLIDLGHPLRFWHLLVFINFKSPMSIGSWLLLLWIAISILIVFLWNIRNRISIKPGSLQRIMDYLCWAGFFVSVFLMGYTGVLLSASIKTLWSATALLPPLFVASAVSTGTASMIIVGLITKIWRSSSDVIRRMVQVETVVILTELVILLTYLFWLSQSRIPGANESMRQLTTGVMAVLFWIGVVLLAILIPFVLDITHWGKKVEEHRIVFTAAAASSACVILGGLILRAVIVIGGQI